MIVPGDPSLESPPGRLAVLGGCGGIGRESVQHFCVEAPGFPAAPLTDARHLIRFADCMEYAPIPAPEAARELPGLIESLDDVADIGQLLRLLVSN